MEGYITEFSYTSMSVNVVYVEGVGSPSSWNILLAGENGLGYSGLTTYTTLNFPAIAGSLTLSTNLPISQTAFLVGDRLG